jgi:CRP/FNR family transcriptional regulator, anaerobic regulatory protein
METFSTQNIYRNTNKCKNCTLAKYCLPALMSDTEKNSAKYLNFPSRNLDPGEHLCRQGEKTNNFYLMRSGVLKSYINKADGDEYIMDFYFPPELFGWEGLDSNQLSFSIIALEHSSICEIPIKLFYSLISTYPLLQQQFINMTNRRIHNDNNKQLRTTAEQRLAHFMLCLKRHYKHLGFAHNMCKLVMTHQDIANYLRLAPATVSRILHQLQKRNILTISRKEIYITNDDKLSELAHGIH